jgi:hypothetical protein
MNALGAVPHGLMQAIEIQLTDRLLADLVLFTAALPPLDLIAGQVIRSTCWARTPQSRIHSARAAARCRRLFSARQRFEQARCRPVRAVPQTGHALGPETGPARSARSVSAAGSVGSPALTGGSVPRTPPKAHVRFPVAAGRPARTDRRPRPRGSHPGDRLRSGYRRRRSCRRGRRRGSHSGK